MSMKKTIEWLRDQMVDVVIDKRKDAVTLDDLLAVVLRLDPYTMDVATRLGIEPEAVTDGQRHDAKMAMHRAAWVNRPWSQR